MKKKRFSAVLGCILALVLIVGIAIPIATASETTYAYLNPFGWIEPRTDQPLAARPATLDDANVRILAYGGGASADTATAIGAALTAAFDGVVITTTSLGATRANDTARSAADYDAWALNTNAVIISVVDDNVGAYWASYHAKELESRGVPVVVVVNDPFETAFESGALKHGFTRVRTAEIGSKWYARAYSRAAGAARQTFIANNVLTVNGTTFAQISTALTAATLPAETEAKMTAPNGAIALTLSATDHAQAQEKFFDLSMQLGFGDGLPLYIPTASLVNAMLATTERDRNEIIGVLLGGGQITVEKVAINAVMAGAIPAYFPVILAAVEAYAVDSEKANLFDFALRTSDSQLSVLLVLSGPISEKIGIRSDRSDIGGGPFGGVKEPNVAIGRAVKLCFRNIGHNGVEDTAMRGAMARFNDHALLVTSEYMDGLPAEWKSHSEMMGFPVASDTVSLIAVTQARISGSGGAVTGRSGWFNSGAAAPLADPTQTNLISQPRTGNTAVAATATEVNIVTYLTYHASAAAASNIGPMTMSNFNIPSGVDELNGGLGLRTKEDLRMAIIANSTNPATFNANATAIRNANLLWPMVIGGDSGHNRIYNAGFTGATATTAYRTQRIGGAAAPGTPGNFAVNTTVGGQATLSWTAPARLGALARYEVSANGGLTWVSAGTDLAYTFALPAGAYQFAVRAVGDGRTTAEIELISGAYAVVYPSRGAWAVATGTVVAITGGTEG